MAIVEAGTESFLVEWYGPHAPAHWIGETARRLNDRAASASERGGRVRLLMAVAIPSDDYAFGVFAAPSAEIVAEICDDAGAHPERISAAVGWWSGQDG
ncbi:hypothetical protein [Mycobacterium sp. E3198]|uniref:hypothetical protein n=1 Tax=Mycobacterium sp. E3198 TaxID=1834143 RepID=UPI000800F110|nr:hypothetical protein [Mycobacterium sp. E3198]OBG28028.1 hypothetical protein A5673_05830 [Mycobacterium sp. E3198]